MTSTAGGRVLSTADARRSAVLRAGVRAFAERGYYGTSTSEVAAEAGISQAYVMRLFGDKMSLFAAVVEHTVERVAAAMTEGAEAAEAAGHTEPMEILHAMGDRYAQLIAERDLMLVQLHAQAAGASDDRIREVERAGYAGMVEHVRALSGAPDDAIQQFFAGGLLCHLATALDLDAVDSPWARTLMAGIRHYPPVDATD